MRILELGSGRDWTKWQNGNQIVDCVDSSYDEETLLTRDFESTGDDNILLHNKDIFTFLEDYAGHPYTKIIANRVMEHIPYDQLHYLFYLLHKVGMEGTMLEVVVPDFAKGADAVALLDSADMKADTFNLGMITTHTEVFNTSDDPHQSIWNQKLAKYYIELERYWKIEDIKHITMEKRHWYMSIMCSHTGD